MTYLWLGGGSAAGKKTLLQAIEDDAKGVRDSLGISGTVVAINAKKGLTLKDILAYKADYVVIKWQYGSRSLIKSVLDAKPEDRHRAVYLNPPPEIHKINFNLKHSDNPKYMNNIAKLGLDKVFDKDLAPSRSWFEKHCPIDVENINPYGII